MISRAVERNGEIRPAERCERPQPRRRPRVEHVLVAADDRLPGLRMRAPDGQVLARRDGYAVLVVPDRDLVSPPELAADAPVAHVLEPVEVDLRPALRAEAQRPGLHRPDRRSGERLHLDEPLLADERLDDALAAVGDGDVVLVGLDLGEEAHLVELLHDLLARLLAREPPVRARVLVQPPVLLVEIDDRQPVTRAALVVGRIVAGRHLDRAGPELALDGSVGDERDLAVEDREEQRLPVQRAVALVVGVHRDARVAEHRLGPRRRDRDELPRATLHRVADRVQLVLAGDVLDLVVGDRGLERAVPVDDARATVDEALVEEAHEGLADGLRHRRLEREARPRPVAGAAQAPELLEDVAPVLLLPLPHFGLEGRATDLLARLLLLLEELPLDDRLGGDARVIGAGHPQRDVPEHAPVADHDVLDRADHRMTHVQDAGDVRRRNHDRERAFPGRRGLGLECPALLPALEDRGFVLGGRVASREFHGARGAHHFTRAR